MTATAFCKACDKDIDISEITFIDNEEYPIVLGDQMSDPNDESEAIKLVKTNPAYGYDEDYEQDGRLKMHYYASSGDISNEDLGDDEHYLDLKHGYWSFL